MEEALSCDTAVAVNAATADGSVIFAKNSDRSANEAQGLCHVPRGQHAASSLVRCQYREIQQVDQTWEVIGSRPYWLWGFEFGVNEWGVAIGNEAVLSREPDEDVALIGMDLVRLGLERARTAWAAVRTIGALVEQYGQGGSCEATTFRTYHNSFIVADPRDAWVLETAGHRWAARRVTGHAAISNLFTIEHAWDLASPGIVEHARDQGWAAEPFSFGGAYQDPDADLRGRVCRLERSRAVLDGRRDPVTVDTMFELLRDHYGGDLPVGGAPDPSICMHLDPGRGGETAAAMVAHLRPDRPRELAVTVWTAFGSPCLSVFRPVYPFGVGLPAELDHGDRRYDPESPWWAFERLQRVVAQAPTLAPAARDALARLESEFRTEAAGVEEEAARLLAAGERERALATLRNLVGSTGDRAVALARRLTAELEPRAAELAVPAMVAAWAGPNDEAGIPPLALSARVLPARR